VLASRVQQSSRGGNLFDSVSNGFLAVRQRVAGLVQRFGIPVAATLIFSALAIIYGPALKKMLELRRRLKRVQRGEVEQSDASLLYNRMLKILERRGIEKPAWVTANEFVRLMPASELTPVVEDLTTLYHELRFGGRREAGPRMLALIEQLERG
jgi:hypothetical protein